MAKYPTRGMALCCGVGGEIIGLRAIMPWLRFLVLCERQTHPAGVLVARMEDKALDSALVWDELDTLDGRPFRGIVDFVTATIPCQGYSVAGKRLLAADPRDCWMHTRRVLGEVRPRWFFMENIPGILTPDTRAGLTAGVYRILGELAQDGFDAEWCCLSSAACGNSHKRERFFLLAHAPRGGEQGRADGQRKEQSGRSGSRLAQPSGEQCRYGGHCSPSDSDGERAPGNTRSQERNPGNGEPVRLCECLADTSRSDLRNPTTGGRYGAPGTTSGTSEQLAQPQRAGREGAGYPRTQRGSEPAALCRDWPTLPFFAPAPNDTEAWRQVLEIDPTLEPAICGVAHAMAHRVDRLRACGNGVDPVSCAVAFVHLFARLRSF